ncbi:UNVERIFIED_CONTAM: hypothetical protein Sindi_0060300 [Sesamum indicum]
MVQLTQEASVVLICGTSRGPICRATAWNPPPPSPFRGRELSSAPEEVEQRGAEALYLPLAIVPPRRSSFTPNIQGKVLPVGLKVSNLVEYDWTASSSWFSFLHHFSMNKKISKMAAFLFTIHQKEGETLRDYMQRFVDAVYETSYVNHELLAIIIQQNLLPTRFKESIAGKPPRTMEDLLVRSQKYIPIEESNALELSLRGKRKGREEEKNSEKKEECKHMPLLGFAHYTPLNASRGEILDAAEQ